MQKIIVRPNFLISGLKVVYINLRHHFHYFAIFSTLLRLDISCYMAVDDFHAVKASFPQKTIKILQNMPSDAVMIGHLMGNSH